MAKTKTPFLSLGSQGTVGQAVTSQKRGSSTLLREKPLPAYRYTLLQAYQRWLYEDYAYLWRQQSAATRQTYATAGTRFHLTGFQYWMKYQLTNLPDIMGWWKLDSARAATTPDSSKQGNNATIIGATPSQPGRINGALSLDGLNDYLNCGDAISMYPPIFTIELFVERGDAGQISFVSGQPAHTRPWITRFSVVTGQVFLQHRQSNGAFVALAANDLVGVVGQLHHIIFTGDGTTLRAYLDGVESAFSTPYDGTIDTATRQPILIGRDRNEYGKGIFDNVLIRNRALDQTEITRNSERRYPP